MGETIYVGISRAILHFLLCFMLLPNSTMHADEAPNTISCLMLDDSMLPTPTSSWMDELFQAQETRTGLVHFFPISRKAAGIWTDFQAWWSNDLMISIAAYQTLIRRYPFEKKFYDQLDVLLMRLNDPDTYIFTWQKCAAYNPELAAIAARKIAALASSCVQQGKLQEASRAFIAAMNLDSNNSRYKLHLARLYDCLGEKDAALELYAEIMRLHGILNEVVARVDALFEDHREPSASLQFWNDLYVHHMDSWIAGMRYGAALEENHQFVDAIEVYKSLVAHHPESIDIYLAQIRCMRRHGQYNEAETLLRKIAPDAQQEFHALIVNEFVTIGQEYIQINEHALAEKCFEAAIQLNPASALAFYNLGELHDKREQFSEALTAFRQAVVLAPENVWFAKRLGMAEADYGNTEKAMAAFRRALLLAPGDVSIQELLDKIQ